MPPLDAALQPALTDVFARLLADAHATARPTSSGVSEVDWIDKFHALVATNLANELRAVLRAGGVPLSVAVAHSLIHGNPFQVAPGWRYGPVEIGDLLLVAERADNHRAVAERHALLVQMKSAMPHLRSRPRDSTTRQAALYSYWPRFDWAHGSVQALLPPPFPRRVDPAPRGAAVFGVLPDTPRGSYDTLSVARPPRFQHLEPLAARMARTIRLELSHDATPGPTNGWPRVIEDILEVAPLRTFRGEPRHTDLFEPAEAASGGRRSRFLAVSVAIAPPGQLD